MIIEYWQSSKEEEKYCFNWETILSNILQELQKNPMISQLTCVYKIGKPISSAISYNRELLSPLTNIQLFVNPQQIEIHEAFMKQLKKPLSAEHIPLTVETPVLLNQFGRLDETPLTQQHLLFPELELGGPCDTEQHPFFPGQFTGPVEEVYIDPNSQASEEANEQQSDAFSSPISKNKNRHKARKAKYYEHNRSDTFEAFPPEGAEESTSNGRVVKHFTKTQLANLIRLPLDTNVKELSPENADSLLTCVMPTFPVARMLLPNITEEQHSNLLMLSRRYKNAQSRKRYAERKRSCFTKDHKQDPEDLRKITQQLMTENQKVQAELKQLSSTIGVLVSQVDCLNRELMGQKSSMEHARSSDPRFFRGSLPNPFENFGLGGGFSARGGPF